MDLTAVAVVIRGGQSRDPMVIFGKLQALEARGRRPLISVYAVNPDTGESDDAALLRVCERSGVPHGKVQRSTAGRLAAAGFTLEHDPSNGQGDVHYNVAFDEAVTESRAADFVASFDEPEPNPAKGKEPT